MNGVRWDLLVMCKVGGYCRNVYGLSVEMDIVSSLGMGIAVNEWYIFSDRGYEL